jgi:hypothetical protein
LLQWLPLLPLFSVLNLFLTPCPMSLGPSVVLVSTKPPAIVLVFTV